MKLSTCLVLLASTVLIFNDSPVAAFTKGKKANNVKANTKNQKTDPISKEMIEQLHKKLTGLNKHLSNMQKQLAQSNKQLALQKQQHDEVVQSYSAMIQEFDKLNEQQKKQVIETVEKKGVSWNKSVKYAAGTATAAALLYYGLTVGAGIDIGEKLKSVGSYVSNIVTKTKQ